jgi:uncharacterized membrane protein
VSGIAVLEFTGVLLAGILAGEEFVVRYGVHPSLTKLDGPFQIKVRQALIRRLRVLVPSVLGPTVITAVAVLVADGSGLRWAGAGCLLGFILITFVGTVPINKAIGDWQADAPPAGWQGVIRRWERLDVARSSAAILAFGFFLAPVF